MTGLSEKNGAAGMTRLNRRTRTAILAGAMVCLLLTLAGAGLTMNPARYGPDYSVKLSSPSAEHPFGADYIGRDMFARSVKGLSNSIIIGGFAAAVSAFIALTLGLFAAAAGGAADRVVSFFVDLFLGIPHLVLLMLISYAIGKGFTGVICAVALTHWPNLTRVIRAEVLQVREAQYVLTAQKLGTKPFVIAARHILPHVLPQFIVGLILLFPHAILHEAAITFLGFGLSVDTPAIGIILAESLKHIATGKWHLVFFPGAMLVIIVMLLDKMGELVKLLIDPDSAQE